MLTLLFLLDTGGIQILDAAIPEARSTASGGGNGYLSNLNIFNPFYWFRSNSQSNKKESIKISSRSDETHNLTSVQANLEKGPAIQEVPFRSEFSRRIVIKGITTATTIRPASTSPSTMTAVFTTIQPTISTTLTSLNSTVSEKPVRTTSSISALFTTTQRPKADGSERHTKKIKIKKNGRIYDTATYVTDVASDKSHEENPARAITIGSEI